MAMGELEGSDESAGELWGLLEPQMGWDGIR